ncbi:HORMA domain-containing protein [Nemania serpens]|nr:HORMA domain-containing protein [Nemania serpens]
MIANEPSLDKTPTPDGTPTGASIALPQATHLLTAFSHFFTVCIHNVLYYRGLYPAATFLTSRAYNLPVHQSRHPAVCSWIRDAVGAVSAQIAQGAVERIAIVVYDAEGAVMERWIFDLARFPAWKGLPRDVKGKEKVLAGEDEDDEDDEDDEEDEDEDIGVDAVDSVGDDDDDDAAAAAAETGAGPGAEQHANQQKVNWTDVDEQLRATVRRLAYASEKLAPLPEGCTYTIAVELRDEAEAPIGHPQPWIPTQPNLQTASKNQETPGQDVGGARTTPLRAVEAGPLFFECWVEEGKAKLGPPSTVSANA